jgi:hypothetical protein
MPEFRLAPGEVQQKVSEYFRREAEHAESLAASRESRAAARESREAARDARREREQERAGWGRYFELSDPAVLRTLNRADGA